MRRKYRSDTTSKLMKWVKRKPNGYELWQGCDMIWESANAGSPYAVLLERTRLRTALDISIHSAGSSEERVAMKKAVSVIRMWGSDYYNTFPHFVINDATVALMIANEFVDVLGNVETHVLSDSPLGIRTEACESDDIVLVMRDVLIKYSKHPEGQIPAKPRGAWFLHTKFLKHKPGSTTLQAPKDA